MENKYTPGPWVSYPCRAKSLYRVETRGSGNDLAPISESTGPDREANARLIAAAPDLLRVAEEADTVCDQAAELLADIAPGDRWAEERIDTLTALAMNARAAIAKATKGS